MVCGGRNGALSTSYRPLSGNSRCLNDLLIALSLVMMCIVCRNPLSGASLRGSAAVHGHNSSTQPLPPPTDRHTSAGSDRYAEPLPPPRAPRSSVTAGRVARRERLEEPDMGPSESSRRIAGGDSGWRAR